MLAAASAPSFGELVALRDRTLEEGHPLLRKEHVLVVHHEPFFMVMQTAPGFLEHAIARVTTFAFVLSGIVALLVALRAAPWPIGLLVLVWLAMATTARVLTRRRRRELGDHVVDFEREIFAHVGPGAMVTAPLSEIALATREDPLDAEARWVTVTLRSVARAPHVVFRVAHGTPAEIDRILFLFRRHGVRERAISLAAP